MLNNLTIKELQICYMMHDDGMI